MFNTRSELLVLALALPSCGCTGDSGRSTPQAMVVNAESDLRIARPEGFDVVDDGPRITLVQSGDLRSPMRIVVWRADEPPKFDGPRTKTLGDVTASYVTSEAEGGSGGAVHLLRAYKPLDTGVVVLEAEVQEEFGVPDFAVAWSVLDGAG